MYKPFRFYFIIGAKIVNLLDTKNINILLKYLRNKSILGWLKLNLI